MRLWSSPYTLKSKTTLSGKTRGTERAGALLMVETAAGIGYADIHPWPELGDLPLETQISLLRDGQTTALTLRSMKLAELDRVARAARVSAFDDLQVPPSHYLINDIMTKTDFEALREEGYRHLKFKLGRMPLEEARRLGEIAPELSGFRLRFDFNGLLECDSFIDFVYALPPEIREAIEFVEDPTPWNPNEWAELYEKTHVPLALDRGGGAGALENSYQWLVIKPAIQEPSISLALAGGRKHCVTTYLDHPVGQTGAALEAARMKTSSTCGLVSHFSLCETEWTERMKVVNACLLPPVGFGIGFDDLFAKVNWSRIR